MKKIYLQPQEIWEHYEQHRAEIDEKPEAVAEDAELGITIFMVGNISFLTLVVIDADLEIVEEIDVDNGVDCCVSADELYRAYIDGDDFQLPDDDRCSLTDEIRADDIDDRESELDSIIEDLLYGICPDELDELYPEMNNIKDHICEWLYKEYKVDIYRPMYLEDEDGNEVYKDFPYGDMDLGE